MYAAIDIGSNTVQLLICRKENGCLLERHNFLRTTRLGDGADGGRLAEEAMARTAQAVAEYTVLMRDAGVTHSCMIATSAVRDASNSEQLRQVIRRFAPDAPPLEIISGEREAELAYAGSRASCLFPDTWPVVDCGGSSSELIYRDKQGIHYISANVGAVRATKNGWNYQEIYQRLAEVYKPCLKTADGLIAVGGTITTAAGLKMGLETYDRDVVEGVVLTIDELSDLAASLQPMSVEKRCAASPLLHERGGIMLCGLWIWLAICRILNVSQLTVTGGGILDGAISEM